MITHTLLLIAVLICGQPATPTPLSLDRIFSSNELDARGVGSMHWSKRSSAYFTFEGTKDGRPGRDLVRHDLESGAQEVIVPAEALVPKEGEQPLAVENFWFSSDESKMLLFTNSRRVWRRNTRGDYWVLDLATRELKKLGGDAAPSTLMFAKFSPDGTRVAYVREKNIYVQELRGMGVTALTDTGSASIINGTGDWVNEEELDIRDGFRWSPSGESIAFWQFDTSGVREFHLIDNTAGSYPSIASFPYPKVGEKNSATRLGVVGVGGGAVRWLAVPGDPREHYLPHMEWTPDGNQLLVQQFNRLQNTNLVMLADPGTGEARTIMAETDPAWLENENPVRWLGRGGELLWLSERDGWRHAYVAGVDGKRFSLVTDGDYDIIDVEAVDSSGGWLYFAASPENATQRYLYRVPLRGGVAQRLSPGGQPGWHTYDISPDAKWAVHTYSTITTPPVVALVRMPGHEVVRVLADNQELRQKLPEVSVEFLKVDIGEHVLDAWWIKPPGMDPAGKYPVLFHVYGEPHGQTVRDAWQGRQGLWHAMLAQEGYIVASVDNRGTKSPRGRAWRKVVHRQIGILAPVEQAAAARALLERWPFADAGRVGIWGWSGGGSMSLNAIFRYPDLYRTAIAVAPNADQLLYDTIYQERYMGLPKDNAQGYRDGSPLAHAAKLQGNLLVVHGTGDDNGHYQGTEMLMNELIAHGKDFTVMAYPARSHSISEGRNTTRHFYGLLTRYFRENLPTNAGPGVALDRKGLQGAGIDGHTRVISGWTVHIARELVINHAAATERAMGLLQAQLDEIVRVVPSAALAELRAVPLYFSAEYPGIDPRAEYHPDAQWLVEHGRNAGMAKGIEFTNVRIFEAESRRMPNFALHELAHAYHDRVLEGGFGNEPLRAAYERAKAGGRYDRVEQRLGDGRTVMVRAYAMTNPEEYFAETTEAFLSTNDFYPFTRSELEHVDPEMVGLLSTLWGIGIEQRPAPVDGSGEPTP